MNARMNVLLEEIRARMASDMHEGERGHTERAEVTESSETVVLRHLRELLQGTLVDSLQKRLRSKVWPTVSVTMQDGVLLVRFLNLEGPEGVARAFAQKWLGQEYAIAATHRGARFTIEASYKLSVRPSRLHLSPRSGEAGG